MKKYLSVILAILVLILSGCNQAPPEKIEKTEKNEETEAIEYSIYCDESAPKKAVSDDGVVIDSSQKVQYQNAGQKNFSKVLSPQKTDDNSDAASIRTLTLHNQTYTFHYKQSSAGTWQNSNLSNLKKISLFDVYKTNKQDGDHIEVLWIRGTNLIQEYINYDACAVESGDFTVEQATRQAEKDLVELYGKDLASRYTFRSAYADPTFGESIFVIYDLKIHGYSTNDYIYFTYNLIGEIETIITGGIGMYSHLSDKLTAERLENAESVLKASIPDTVEQGEAFIVLDIEGTAYLRINGTWVDEYGDTRTTQYYINIY